MIYADNSCARCQMQNRPIVHYKEHLTLHIWQYHWGKPCMQLSCWAVPYLIGWLARLKRFGASSSVVSIGFTA